jgi:hypothetical protein
LISIFFDQVGYVKLPDGGIVLSDTDFQESSIAILSWWQSI